MRAVKPLGCEHVFEVRVAQAETAILAQTLAIIIFPALATHAFDATRSQLHLEQLEPLRLVDLQTLSNCA